MPISVIMPPSMEANDNGISDSAGLRLAFAAAWMFPNSVLIIY